MNDLVKLLEDRVRRASERIESLRQDNEALRRRAREAKDHIEPAAVDRDRIVAVLKEAVADLRAD